MSAEQPWIAGVRAKMIVRRDAQELAKRIVEECGDGLRGVVRMEAGRLIREHLNETLDSIHEAQRLIEANPRKNPRNFIIKTLGGISNKLTILSAAYASGALPK